VSALAQALGTRPVVLDGGLATHLEAGGADLSGGLWSARLLLDPVGRRRVVRAHADFLRAGAEVLTTASYQLGATSLGRVGLDPATATDLAALSVQVAHEAATEVGTRAWVAGSVGAYGALLADGSEYTGDYDLGDEADTVAALVEVHAPRVEALLAAGADVVAVETLPRAAEVEAVARVLERSGAPAWVALTVAPGGTTTRRGEPLADVVAPLAGLPRLVAVGVNCVRPEDVPPALRVLSSLDLPLVAYPNSGETWDAVARRWTGSVGWDAASVPSWLDAGARLVGGCCRVGPEQVAGVRAVTSARDEVTPQ